MTYRVTCKICFGTAAVLVQVLTLLLMFSGTSEAAAILGGRRFVYPTISGEEYTKQVQVVDSATASVEEKVEALRLLGGATPSHDEATVALLLEATHSPIQDLQVQAVKSLANVARIDDQADYDRWREHIEGTKHIGLADLYAMVVPRLIELLRDPNANAELEAAAALGEIPPSDKRVVRELLDAETRVMPGSNAANGNASQALVRIATQIRQRQMFGWSSEMETIVGREARSTIFFDGPDLNAELRAFKQDMILHRWQWLIDNWRLLASALVALHIALYIGVFIGTRWSIRCCRLLCDPVFLRLSVYTYPALRYSWLLQRWILCRYVEAETRRTRATGTARYVSMALRLEHGDDWISPEPEHALRTLRHIWLVGAPGMGKTSYVRHLHDVAFDPYAPASVNDVVRRFGSIPIFATLRDYESIEIDLKTDPDGWVIAIVQRVLARMGVPIHDKGILRGFLRSGRLAIVLDGANETNRSGEICDYARMNRETPILVTSRVGPGLSNSDELFSILRLPDTIDEYVEPIVTKYMGSGNSANLLERITGSGLRESLRSGYDVRLVVDFATEFTALDMIPRDRRSLYDGYVQLLLGREGAREVIFDVSSKAWGMLSRGDRRFKKAELSPVALEVLLDEAHPILARVRNDELEFRHDQMRAFFAGKYLAYFPIDVRIARLRDADIWKQRNDEQEDLWTFCADLARDCEELGILWLFSIERPEYGIFQHALQRAGKTRGCAWLPIPAVSLEEPETVESGSSIPAGLDRSAPPSAP